MGADMNRRALKIARVLVALSAGAWVPAVALAQDAPPRGACDALLDAEELPSPPRPAFFLAAAPAQPLTLPRFLPRPAPPAVPARRVPAVCASIPSREAIWRGGELIRAGWLSEGLAKYELAARLEPGDARLMKYVGWGWLLIAKQKSGSSKGDSARGKAIEQLETYLRAYPQDSRMADYLASLYPPDRADASISGKR
jgi:hypothetical protein